MFIRKTYFFLLTFLSIAILSFIFFMQYNQTVHPEQSTNRQPQEYMMNVHVNSFTEEGHLKNAMSARYWAYLPTQKMSALDAPKLTVYKSDNVVWHIQAKHGQAKQSSLASIDQITLQQNVVLERPETLYAAPLRLESEELQYQPEIQYVKTDQQVTIRKPGIKMTGIGMRAFLDKESMELMQNVKTYYTKTP